MNRFFRIRDLSVWFETRKGTLKVIDQISLDVGKNEVLAVLGESGSGKSVLGHAIMRILDSNARVNGSIFLHDLNLQKFNEKNMEKIRGNRLAIVMQNPDLAFNPVLKLGAQLIESLLVHQKAGKIPAREKLKKILMRLGLENLERIFEMYPHQLSGGMKQRLLIAAALATEPEMTIADEPTKGLDDANRNLVIDELHKIRETTRCSLILITHDTSLAFQLADRVAVMYAGEIIELSPVTSFFRKPLHPYSQDLLNALPKKGFQPIQGQSPSFDRLPGGCRFHPRCRQKLPLCSQERPEMIKTKKGLVKCIRY